MIDEALAALRAWRDNRDRAEARDLKLRLSRQRREYDAAVRRQEEYKEEHKQQERAAYSAALAEAGIILERSFGWPKYKTADDKTHLGRPQVWVEVIPYDPPAGPSPELRHAIEVTELQIDGRSREEAEAIVTKEDARLADIGEWAKHSCAEVGYQYRPDWRDPVITHAISDRIPRGHGHWEPASTDIGGIRTRRQVYCPPSSESGIVEIPG
jgi:hypothetical protein